MILKLEDFNGYTYLETKYFKTQWITTKQAIVNDECGMILRQLPNSMLEERKDLVEKLGDLWLEIDNGKRFICPNGLFGFVLNDKGQTIDKLDLG